MELNYSVVTRPPKLNAAVDIDVKSLSVQEARIRLDITWSVSMILSVYHSPSVNRRFIDSLFFPASIMMPKTLRLCCDSCKS